jgi:hypothetical protein
MDIVQGASVGNKSESSLMMHGINMNETDNYNFML